MFPSNWDTMKIIFYSTACIFNPDATTSIEIFKLSVLRPKLIHSLKLELAKNTHTWHLDFHRKIEQPSCTLWGYALIKLVVVFNTFSNFCGSAFCGGMGWAGLGCACEMPPADNFIVLFTTRYPLTILISTLLVNLCQCWRATPALSPTPPLRPTDAVPRTSSIATVTLTYTRYNQPNQQNFTSIVITLYH